MAFDLGIEISAGLVVFLVACAFVAGFVDSIAGGGGMITIPALLFAGIPPLQALGTNKFQSCFGSFGASLHFYKRGHIDLKGSVGFVCVVFLSSMLGSVCVGLFESDFLRKCIPFLLILFAFYFLFSPKITQDSSKAILGSAGLGFVLGIIGFYDGFLVRGQARFLCFLLLRLGAFHCFKPWHTQSFLILLQILLQCLSLPLGGIFCGLWAYVWHWGSLQGRV